ncbi:MAG: cell division protein ZipA [Piscirickettsiaceae bacterium]|nr:MAG: cell division protein ZipA [Piscirickettsiaceae bacterium]
MEETALRLLLIVIGLFVLFGIYFYDRIKNRSKQDNDFINEASKVQPVIVDEMTEVDEYSASSASNKIDVPLDDALEEFNADSSNPQSSRLQAEAIPVVEQAPVIQLLVVPANDTAIAGVALLNVFTALNLEFGDMGIFHRYRREQGVETQVFHVANILEPGTFPVGNMSDFETKGVVLFFQASQTVDSNLSFDDMLESARELCQRFECNLLNAAKQELTFEKIDDIRELLAKSNTK